MQTNTTLKRTNQISDSYIAKLLKMPVTELRGNYPYDLIESKRIIIKIKRFIEDSGKHEVDESDIKAAEKSIERGFNPGRINSISKLKSNLLALYYDLITLRICDETAALLIHTTNLIINSCIVQKTYQLHLGDNKRIEFLTTK